MNNIYVSYSDDDMDFVRKLIAQLERRGYRVCSHATFGAETSWAKGLANELDQCQAFVVVLSRNAIGSDLMPRELRMATDRGKPIVSLAIDSSPVPQEMDYVLALTRPIGFYQVSFDEALGRLLEALTKHGFRPKRVLGRRGKFALLGIGGLAVFGAVIVLIILAVNAIPPANSDTWLPTQAPLPPAVQLPPSYQPTSMPMTTLTLNNNWLQNICDVYIFPAGSGNPGPDWLPADVIPPGYAYTFPVPVGVYDVTVFDCAGAIGRFAQVAVSGPVALQVGFGP